MFLVRLAGVILYNSTHHCVKMPLNISQYSTQDLASQAKSTDAADMVPVTIFNLLPPAMGESLLTALLISGMFFGVLLIETIKHIGYDVRLICKPGWSVPSKCITRLTYFGCRYLSIAGFVLLFGTLAFEMDHCKAFAWTSIIVVLFLFACNTLIFVYRTIALYAWDFKVVSPVLTLFALSLVAAAACVPFDPSADNIPGTKFCVFSPSTHPAVNLITIILYRASSALLDIVLFALTLHRLLEGGLKSLWSRKTTQLFSGTFDSSLSSYLVRQGFHFYAVQVVCDAFFISAYFGFQEPFFKIIPAAMYLCVPSLAAAGAFRDTGKKASEIGVQNALHVNEIMGSGTFSGGHSASRKTFTSGNFASSTVLVPVLNRK